MGMSLCVESKIVSKEDYDKFLNGEVYLDNYEGLKFVNKQEIDAEIAKVKEFFEKNISDEIFDEKYFRIFDYWRWEEDYDYELFENNKDFFNNLKFFKEEHTYFAIDEWLNYEDDELNYIERTINSANINGQDVYCLIDAKFW